MHFVCILIYYSNNNVYINCSYIAYRLVTAMTYQLGMYSNHSEGALLYCLQSTITVHCHSSMKKYGNFLSN